MSRLSGLIATTRRPRTWLVAPALASLLLAGCGATATRSAHSTSRAQGSGAAATQTTTTATPSQALLGLQSAYVAVVHKVGPSVVQISTRQDLGSGIIFNRQGDIVTNNHVVNGARRVTVTLANGHQYPGTVVSTFPPDDLAVIHITATGLQPAQFANSAALQVGDIVMAIGNPLGLQSSVSTGIISATGRTVSEPNGVTLPDVLQTSAAINPGNSGGALVDLAGQVVGIPTLAALDPQLGGGQAPGIGFAIPSNVVTDIAGQIARYGRVVHSNRAYLGIEVEDVIQPNGNPGGALVVRVVSGGPAARAGLRAQEVILGIAGHPVGSAQTLTGLLAAMHPGQQVALQVQKPDGSKATLTVKLGQYPSVP